jgi:hypothetical protein
LRGRVAEEALPGGAIPAVTAGVLQSGASPTGLRTVVAYQQVGPTRYFDAAGFPGRSVGLDLRATGR